MRLVRKSANDAGRCSVKLAADQAGGGREFVGYRFKARVQGVAVRIAAPAIIAQRFHPRNANAEIREPFAPRTAEAVSNDNGDGELGGLLEGEMKSAGRTVRIGGQKQGVSAAIDVGNIYSTVGTDKTVLRFRDEHSILAADNGSLLARWISIGSAGEARTASAAEQKTRREV
jgi:hypothetical protein